MGNRLSLNVSVGPLASSIHRGVVLVSVLVSSGVGLLMAQAPATRPPDLVAQAWTVLPGLDGTGMVFGLRQPVEVLRDEWGVPHIYAKNTHDLFFAQGYVVAQDRMWQMELWRRNGEGRLAEVLGADYVTRDTFARLLAFRGNWDEEFRKYHPEGPVIFDAFARGVNAAIQKALDEGKVPVEFQIMGFQPQPVWTAKTVLTRMPGWQLSRNASSEVQRALDVKLMGVAKVEELKPTDPEKPFVVPPGLNLDDIEPAILGVTRGANDIRWSLAPKPAASASNNPSPRESLEARTRSELSPNPWLDQPDLGSNNWVIGGAKSVTGRPIIANDPHREIVNPALRYVVHLNAPGWNAIGATEPGLPGISIGHNDHLAWGFTILGVDQQDLYIEETDPRNPNRYLVNGEYKDMVVERQLVWVKGSNDPVEIDLKFTRHGPVLYENAKKQRAFALRWVGAEPGGAGYLGSLNVMQAKSWKEFNEALPKSWYLPSHSLVYADVEGNYGYVGVALTPVRNGWDGLLPVPGKDSKYEWAGYVPFDKLPKSLNGAAGFYNSSNNDVVPKILPGYNVPLGYEYNAPYRYDRVHEVLAQNKKFSLADMERLQQDVVSLPARELVPLLKTVTTTDPAVAAARDLLLGWNFSLDRNSVPATIYQFWAMKLGPLAFAPRVPENGRQSIRAYDMRRIIAWMKNPDRAYGANPRQARDRILGEALTAAVADLRKQLGDDMKAWQWGAIHTADFVHPLMSPQMKDLFFIEPVRRGGDSFTVMLSTSASEAGTKQTVGGSFMFVFDTQDWDRSTGLSVPGNSAQPLSPHYKDLIPYWGEGKYFPMAFGRAKVEEVAKHRLMLHPIVDVPMPSMAASTTWDPTSGDKSFEGLFEPVQTELFNVQGGQANAWADYDGDGDLDLFVGFRGGLSRLYRNDNGTFVDVAPQVGLADENKVRVAAWGDYDDDGDPDLFVGGGGGDDRTNSKPNRLYRNEGGKRFIDVGYEMGVDLIGNTRQAAFLDYDNDGDLDFFVAFRNRPNAMYRNDGGKYTDVATQVGLADPRKTVGVVWFDMDADGDLDCFVANQNGDMNGFFRNDAGRFTDIAKELGMDGGGRPLADGSVGPSVVDYDKDGDLDLYVANYGPNVMWRNDGGGKFTEVAAELGIAGDYHATTSVWGDLDNDGWPDVYVASMLANTMNVRDYLYRNVGGKMFQDVIPSIVLKHDATHGVQWVDYDQDGDLDLALADNGTRGVHYLYRNRLAPALRQQSVSVMVLDERGRFTRAGSEVRVYKAGTRTLLGSGMVDTGSGYCSQNMMPVHVGLGVSDAVDVEVTSLTKGGRKVTRVTGVDPKRQAGKPLVIKTGGPMPSAM